MDLTPLGEGMEHKHTPEEDGGFERRRWMGSLICFLIGILLKL
jgi:hypothetical protein